MSQINNDWQDLLDAIAELDRILREAEDSSDLSPYTIANDPIRDHDAGDEDNNGSR